MEQLGPIELVMLLLVVATVLAYVARRIGVAVPDPPRARRPGPRRPRVRAGPGPPRRGPAGARPRLPAVPAADPVRLGLHDADPRPQGQRAADRACSRSGWCCSRPSSSGSWSRGWSRSCAARRRFTLGAIVAPPDAVAATAVFRRLGVPPRIVTILEGESLINDASALIAYRVAIAVAMTGIFSLAEAGRVVRRGRPRRDRGRGRRRLAGHQRLAAHGRPDAGDRPLAARAADRLPVRRAARGERRPRDGDRRAHRRPKAARVLSPDGRLMGQGVWAVAHLPDQQLRVHAHRAAAADGPPGSVGVDAQPSSSGSGPRSA